MATDLLTPGTLAELADALGRATARTRLLAGGTDLVRALGRDRVRPDLIIDLSGMDDLAAVRLDGGTIRIGATATFAQLAADPLVRRRARCLAEAAAQVGSAQIRNTASIGGNLANASPCADSMPPLVALRAQLAVLDSHGRVQTLPVEEVVTGSGHTTLRCDEAIVEIAFAALDEGHRAAFVKIGARSTVTVARLSMALVVRYHAGAGALHEARVALGAVGATAFRDARLEEALEGRPPNEESARLFAEECTAAVQRAIPGRYSLPYKEAAALGLAYDAWNALGVCPPCEPWGRQAQGSACLG